MLGKGRSGPRGPHGRMRAVPAAPARASGGCDPEQCGGAEPPGAESRAGESDEAGERAGRACGCWRGGRGCCTASERSDEPGVCTQALPCGAGGLCTPRGADPGASGRDLVTHTPRRPPLPALDRTSSRGQGSTGNRVSWGQRGPQLGHRRASSGDAVTGRGGRAERGRAAESAQGGHWLAGEQGHPRLALIGREVRPSSVQRAVAGSRCSSREGAGVSAPCPGRGRHFRLESHVRGRGPRGRGAAGVLRSRSPPPPAPGPTSAEPRPSWTPGSQARSGRPG